jgi:hypothetical protein
MSFLKLLSTSMFFGFFKYIKFPGNLSLGIQISNKPAFSISYYKYECKLE